MSQYANLLASQGSLFTALTYLPDNTNQVCKAVFRHSLEPWTYLDIRWNRMRCRWELNVQLSSCVNTGFSATVVVSCHTSVQVAIQQLRDRLSRALGQQTVQTRRAQAQHGSALPRHPFTPVQPAMVPQAPAAAPALMPTPASAPAQQQYYQPVCSTNILSPVTVFTQRSKSILLFLWYNWRFHWTGLKCTWSSPCTFYKCQLMWEWLNHDSRLLMISELIVIGLCSIIPFSGHCLPIIWTLSSLSTVALWCLVFPLPHCGLHPYVPCVSVCFRWGLPPLSPPGVTKLPQPSPMSLLHFKQATPQTSRYIIAPFTVDSVSSVSCDAFTESLVSSAAWLITDHL